MPISLYNRKEKGGIKNEKIYIVIEDKKRVFGHSEFLLVNARPRVYHRTIVYERNASDSTR